MDKAVEIILKKGIVKAAARAGRVATEGEVRTSIANGGKHATIVEVNCQTDFVARGDDFKRLRARTCSRRRAGLQRGANLGATKSTATPRRSRKCVRRWSARSARTSSSAAGISLDVDAANGLVHAYVHMGGKIAVLVTVDAPSTAVRTNPDFVHFVDDVAMQIASMKPLTVRREDLDKTTVEKQREILDGAVQGGAGRARAEQAQARGDVVEDRRGEGLQVVRRGHPPRPGLGPRVRARGRSKPFARKSRARSRRRGEASSAFVRFELGEGIEKKSDNLAAEVAKMTGRVLTA